MASNRGVACSRDSVICGLEGQVFMACEGLRVHKLKSNSALDSIL